MKDFKKVDNIYSVQEIKKSASGFLYKTGLKKKKSRDIKILKNNKNSRKFNYNKNYMKISTFFEKIKGSPNKSNINALKEKNKKSKTTDGKINYFKSFLGKQKLLSQSEIYNNTKDNCIGKQDKEINLDKKEKQNINISNNNYNKIILLTKLNEYQKREINYKKNENQKIKNTLKNEIQKKINKLQSEEQPFNNLENKSIEKIQKKRIINNRRNEIRETMIYNTNEPKKRITNLRYTTINRRKTLFTSYSNINDIYLNKKIKTPINSVKSKINTFEFIKKIKKRISPSKKIIFNTNIYTGKFNKNEDENEKINNLENINIKNIINNYIKTKKKERKKNEMKKKERINKENIKKYKNFIILQENIKDSLINEINKKRNNEEEKCNENNLKKFENTNKSSVFNENEYYINCYEAQQIYNDDKIINNSNLKNKFSKEIEYHINLNNIRNNKNINKENQSFLKYFENEYKQIEKVLKNNNDLYKRLNINNNIINKQKQNIKENKKSKYKEFIEKINCVLIKVIKRKYFELLRFKINSFNSFIIKLIKIIKSFIFSFLKKYINNIKIINQFINIINKLNNKNHFLKIKIFVKRKKYQIFIFKIKKIFLHNYYNYFKQKQELIKQNNNIITRNEKISNSVDSNKNINDIKDINLLNEDSKNKEDNNFLNTAFFHNKEIFKNLRYEDDDDFFVEESEKENNLSNEIKDNNMNNNNSFEKKIIELKEYFNKISIKIKNNIKEDLTEQIIKEIIDTEIKNKEKIINKKLPIIQFENKQKEIISNINNITHSNNNSQVESSLENSINISLLKKSIGEIKEGRKLNKYFQNKFPVFLKMIINNIKLNYNEIINNLKKPLIIDEERYINQLNSLLNKKTINNNNNNFYFNKDKNEIEFNEQKNYFLSKFTIPFYNNYLIKQKFIDENILKEFNLKNELMNKESNDETINILFYDKCLNKCVYDTVNEIIGKKRMYDGLGKPLLWISRNKLIRYNFDNTQYSKKIFIKEIMNELKEIINTKIGLIPENYDYMSLDHLISDREKKFIKNIYNDLLENEEKDNNIDLIFTSILMNISKLIMEQLLEEVIQILNLIEQSRKEPSKFESKSIYAYDSEDIPIFLLGEKNDYEEDNYFFQ